MSTTSGIDTVAGIVQALSSRIGRPVIVSQAGAFVGGSSYSRRMKVGYSRVSTKDQDIDAQRARLIALGVGEERIYLDHGFTGKNLERGGLQQALAAVRARDTIVVPRLDRFARNAEETLRLVRELTERDVTFQMGATAYDPRDPWSKLFLTFLAAMAEAEGGWISLRTQEATARPSVRAKLRGKQPSKTPKEDAAIARHLDGEEFTVAEIAMMFSTSRAGVYRAAERRRNRVAASAS